MSIIADPYNRIHRALLLVASSREGSISSVNYLVYKLQTNSSPTKKERVLARLAANGSIPFQLGRSPDLVATDSVTGIFLAGGSFSFQLDDNDASTGEYILVGVRQRHHTKVLMLLCLPL
jgi:hypothetical protein